MSGSFEDNIKKLEKIVQELESSELPLDKSVELYSKGVALSAECKNLLDNARLKITEAKCSDNDEE